jgi:hypothetical protein
MRSNSLSLKGIVTLWLGCGRKLSEGETTNLLESRQWECVVDLAEYDAYEIGVLRLTHFAGPSRFVNYEETDENDGSYRSIDAACYVTLPYPGVTRFVDIPDNVDTDHGGRYLMYKGDYIFGC